MKRIVSVLLSVMMIAGIFTSIPLSASAAKSSVSLKKKSATLKITKKNGKKVYGTVKITVKKEKGVSINKISYKSKKASVAKVSKKGLVTAKKKGSAKIKVTVKYTYKKITKTTVLTFSVKVTDNSNKAFKPVVKPTSPAEIIPETTAAVETTEAEATTEATEITEAETVPETTETAEATEEPETIAPSTVEPETTVPETEAQEETSSEVIEDTTVQETTEESTAYEAGGEANQDLTEDTSPASEETTAATEEATVEETIPAPETFNEKLSAFSNKLYALTAKRQDNNYIFSPVSVYFALSLLYSMGDDNVKQDIAEFVGMSDEEIKKSGELFTQLISKCYHDDELVGEVALTNSIWNDITISDRMSADKLKELAEDYNAQSFEAPFSTDNKEANEMVTDFVKEQTRGLIDKDFKIPSSTIIALINTIYFKDVWNLGSDDLDTEQREFKTDDESKECEFLKGYYFDGKIQSTDTFDYFFTKMAFGYKIKFILPKDGYTLEEVMTAENLYRVNYDKDYDVYEVLGYEDLTEDEANYYRYNYSEWNDPSLIWDDPTAIKFNCNNYTRCIFPSFKIDSHTPLYNILKENGLDSALKPFETDLLISENPDDNLVVVSDIYQDAVIEVDKSGVKAAAVTVISEEADSAAEEEIELNRYYQLVMNKNFAFILTDSNDVILFEGKVYDPTV